MLSIRDGKQDANRSPKQHTLRLSPPPNTSDSVPRALNRIFRVFGSSLLTKRRKIRADEHCSRNTHQAEERVAAGGLSLAGRLSVRQFRRHAGRRDLRRGRRAALGVEDARPLAV